MAEIQKRDKINTTLLANKLKQGLATKEELGIVSKTINTQLAVEMLASLDEMKKRSDKLEMLRKKATDKLVEKGEMAIEADEMSMEDLMELVDNLTDNELKITDMYRKILQNGNRALFDDDSLSEGEKVVVRLMRCLAKQDDKKAFIGMTAQFMKDKGLDYEDAEVVG